MLPLYGVFVGLAVWLVLAPAKLVGIALGRTSLSRLRQRLGRVAPWRECPQRVVLHAVSAGEMAVAEALLTEWSRPRSSVLLTAGCRDGLAVGERIRARRAEIEDVLLLPWDRTAALRRWLQEANPEMVVVIETEIWPGLFAACDQLGIVLVVVNGRLDPRDVRRYRLLPGFFRRVLSSAAWIGTPNEVERGRWIDIGAPEQNVESIGQLKYDGAQEDGTTGGDDPVSLAADLAGQDGLLVAASTHRPEEKLLLRTLAELKLLGAESPRMVVAPRHTRRAGAIRRMARRSGFRATLTSELLSDAESASDWDVLILDRMGDLGGVLRHAAVVVQGGTFAPVGGHNVLEAAARGRAVVTGPFTSQVEETIEELVRQEALVRLESGRQLTECLAELLRNDERRHQLGHRARVAVAARKGAAAAYAKRLDELSS